MRAKELNMRKFMLLTTLAAVAVVAVGITAQAQTYGPGMMGNDQNYGNRGDCGQGYGMMGNGNSQTNGQGQGDNQGQNQEQSRGYGPGYHMRGSGGGYGPGMMQGNGYGSGMMQGNGNGPGYGNGYDRRGNVQGNQTLNLTTDDVKSRVERWLVRQGNQRLKVGDVKENDADTITADVVTKDNSLVDRFIVDRHTGAVHQDKS
jgi:hypothetical protein